ncbi:bifunctional RNase H/acid phosphatase [Nocardioides marmorisolisilvae]|uniref:Bifunctional RNase H/acid phosphatase n=1 Tax=Nocardioides marmorisolisilvae TaxID=1542737 RepID=A0A3N0DTH5_9ACTN|nr:bifunctional RNase H/acid phosphatase [Nocardioides marmorisolisilvae]RNL78929.1 bifunctional RNase H/acid phosphatase [Nocardioides marmorisolisilvae]
MTWSSVVVEADGGSRGNPGPAAFGAVLKDAESGETIAEVGETIGTATNNVAEYRGLIAGLELAAEHAPGAALEVRMDSQLVIEQMAGNWKVKHPSMKPLQAQAATLAPAGTTYTWVPRAENSHADRLVNDALDGSPTYFASSPADGGTAKIAEPDPSQAPPSRGWMPPGDPPTTLVLVRHGVTDHTANRLFSGGLGGSNPPLNDEGREQVRATGEWLAPLAGAVDALVTSPVRRTAESAEILGSRLGLTAKVEDGIAEMEFGAWDGMTFVQIQETYPDDLSSWLGSLEFAPTGGESFRVVQERVLAGRDRILADHTGQTVLVVSHVTPIKTLVADALGAPLEAIYKMELSPASVTVISYFRGNPPNSGREDDHLLASLRLYNGRPTDAPFAV